MNRIMPHSPETIEWRPHPQRHNSVCAFTAAVGEASALHSALEHNANWAVAHGSSYTLFTAPLAPAVLNPQWEKVFAARQMLDRDECRWLLHVDADAVVVDVTRDPLQLLHRMEAEALPARPAIFATCNSPLGRGLDCDVFCCGRQSSPRRRDGLCAVGLHDVGPASPCKRQK